MRVPTVLPDLYNWHRSALAGHAPQITSEPQVGWFRRKLVRGGVWVPARIWLNQDIDEETGELIGDEKLRCEVDGKECDPTEQWTYLADKPISASEYDYLTATANWAVKHAPDEPEANPREKLDFTKLPLQF